MWYTIQAIEKPSEYASCFDNWWVMLRYKILKCQSGQSFLFGCEKSPSKYTYIYFLLELDTISEFLDPWFDLIWDANGVSFEMVYPRFAYPSRDVIWAQTQVNPKMICIRLNSGFNSVNLCNSAKILILKQSVKSSCSSSWYNVQTQNTSPTKAR